MNFIRKNNLVAVWCCVLSSFLPEALTKTVRAAKNRSSIVPNLYPLEMTLKVHGKRDLFCLNTTVNIEVDCPEVLESCQSCTGLSSRPKFSVHTGEDLRLSKQHSERDHRWTKWRQILRGPGDHEIAAGAPQLAAGIRKLVADSFRPTQDEISDVFSSDVVEVTASLCDYYKWYHHPCPPRCRVPAELLVLQGDCGSQKGGFRYLPIRLR